MCARRNKTITAAILLGGALFALAACSDNPAGPDGIPNGGSPSVNPVILLKNEANVPIVSVNIARCTDEEWGVNRLSNGQTIPTGEMRYFSITPGCWDVRASTGQKYGTWWDYDVEMGDTVRLALSSAANSLMNEIPAGMMQRQLKLR